MENNMRIIAGPCQHETLAQSAEIARECKRVCDRHGIEYYFKASFDKANRTSANGKRGVGLHPFVHDILALQETLDVKTLTDVHEVDQVQYLKDIVDVLQIPAFLCRQTDLIRAACDTNCIVNIKKGQFLAPGDVQGILSKTEGAREVWITERGTSFGYGRLINDFSGMHDLLSDLGSRFVYDVTHSVQRPGGNGTSSGGDRKYVPHLARAGAALGVSSFFLEVHADPDNAPSDGPNMLHLKDFEDTVKQIKVTYDAANNWRWL
jgi:2-dehydro-3-deoxyphosphooctonate aldolase (KDO 8-P synthase)